MTILQKKMKYDDALDANNCTWKASARAMMENKKCFVVVNWDFSFDGNDSKALAQEFSYNFSFDPSQKRAFFEPLKPD
jgi:hypothetical protein